MTYYVTDRESPTVEIEADSAEEAAHEFCEGGAWGQEDGTVWVDVWVDTVDDDHEDYDPEMITVTLDPEEPECTEDKHDWQSPEWLGGCKENPGVFSHGGGTKGTNVCANCGAYRDWDGWAQRPDTGQQGLDSVAYRETDEISEKWAEKEQLKKHLDEADEDHEFTVDELKEYFEILYEREPDQDDHDTGLINLIYAAI